MNTHQPPLAGRLRVVAVIVLFELALGVLGVGVAWVARVPLGPVCWPPQTAWTLGLGLAADLLLMPFLVLMLQSRWRPLARLRWLVRRLVRQWLAGASGIELLAIAVAAGVGEEVLFRGAIQPLVVHFTNPLLGILLASLLFGAVHAATRTYFVLATLIGVYFGALAWWQGEILSAAVAHAFYDFVALRAILPPRGPALERGSGAAG